MQAMKFVKGESGTLGVGRRDHSTLLDCLARQMLATHAEEIIAATIKAPRPPARRHRAEVDSLFSPVINRQGW
jgi:hypothetical protein